MKIITLKMRGLKTIKLVGIIPYILEKCSSIDMLLFKNLGGVISLLFGSAKISSIKLMSLSKYRRALLTIWKLPLMRLKFCKRCKTNARVTSGKAKVEMILTLLVC
jgi:hypothetical protein